MKAAVEAHKDVGCNITHKVHLMWCHVAWQMGEIEGGLGDKMEDWVEKAHQEGARRRRRFYFTVNAKKRANAAAKVEQRDMNPEVVAWKDGVDERAKKVFTNPRKSKAEEMQAQRKENGMKALRAHQLMMAHRAEAADPGADNNVSETAVDATTNEDVE